MIYGEEHAISIIYFICDLAVNLDSRRKGLLIFISISQRNNKTDYMSKVELVTGSALCKILILFKHTLSSYTIKLFPKCTHVRS
jgi:hypothetical protein